jgi:hypothetical protein
VRRCCKRAMLPSGLRMLLLCAEQGASVVHDPDESCAGQRCTWACVHCIAGLLPWHTHSATLQLLLVRPQANGM